MLNYHRSSTKTSPFDRPHGKERWPTADLTGRSSLSTRTGALQQPIASDLLDSSPGIRRDPAPDGRLPATWHVCTRETKICTSDAHARCRARCRLFQPSAQICPSLIGLKRLTMPKQGGQIRRIWTDLRRWPTRLRQRGTRMIVQRDSAAAPTRWARIVLACGLGSATSVSIRSLRPHRTPI